MGSGNSTPQVAFYEELKKLLGVNAPTRVFYRTHVEVDETILERFSIDTRYIRIQPPFGHQPQWVAPNAYKDEWGATWEKPASSLYWDPKPPIRWPKLGSKIWKAAPGPIRTIPDARPAWPNGPAISTKTQTTP